MTPPSLILLRLLDAYGSAGIEALVGVSRLAAVLWAMVLLTRPALADLTETLTPGEFRQRVFIMHLQRLS